MAVATNPEENFVITWFKSLNTKRIRILRFLSQVGFFILINGAFLGLARLPIPAPIHMPPGSPYATVWGGFSAIQFLLSAGQFPFFAIGIFFLTGGLVGRLFCGWVCPVGFWQDILSWLPTEKWKISRPTNEAWKDFAGILMWSSVVFAIFIGWRRLNEPFLIDNFASRMPFDAFDPAGTLFATWYYIMSWDVIPGDDGFFGGLFNLGNLALLKTAIFLLVSFISIKVPRAYCRWICPTGALLGYCSKYSALTVKRDPLKCQDGCRKCEDACPMDIPITEYGLEGINDSLCTSCGNCIDACPDAMSFGIRS